LDISNTSNTIRDVRTQMGGLRQDLRPLQFVPQRPREPFGGSFSPLRRQLTEQADLSNQRLLAEEVARAVSTPGTGSTKEQEAVLREILGELKAIRASLSPSPPPERPEGDGANPGNK
jgi:hypothetical protein